MAQLGGQRGTWPCKLWAGARVHAALLTQERREAFGCGVMPLHASPHQIFLQRDGRPEAARDLFPEASHLFAKAFGAEKRQAIRGSVSCSFRFTESAYAGHQIRFWSVGSRQLGGPARQRRGELDRMNGGLAHACSFTHTREKPLGCHSCERSCEHAPARQIGHSPVMCCIPGVVDPCPRAKEN